MRRLALGISAALATLALAPVAQAATEAAPATRSNCFASNQWKGWNAGPSGDTLYLRVNINDVYEVNLTPGSHARKSAGRFLVNEVRGSNWICSAVDLDLSIADELGFHQPLIARSMRKLTPEEVAAIPRKHLP